MTLECWFPAGTALFLINLRLPEAVDRLDGGIYILGGDGGGRRRTIACTSQSPGTPAPWSSSRKTKVTWIVLRFQHS